MKETDLTDFARAVEQPKPGIDTLSSRLMDEMLNDKNKSACSAADSIISKNDLDKDGQLSFLELANIFGKESGTGIRDVRNMITAIETINLLDANHDNMISNDELVASLRKPSASTGDLPSAASAASAPLEPVPPTDPSQGVDQPGVFEKPPAITSPFVVTPRGSEFPVNKPYGIIEPLQLEEPFWRPEKPVKIESPLWSKEDEAKYKVVSNWLFLPSK